MLRLLVLSSIVILGDASFVSSLPKCGMSDSECHRDLLQAILHSIGKTGVKELGVPPIDPLELRNVSVSIADVFEVSLVKGVAKGLKDCKIDSMKTDIPRGDISLDLICDITIKGHYQASSSSPLIKSFLGGQSVHGDGNGKLKVEKMRLHFDFKVYVHRDEDGEVYVSGIYNQTKYNFEILGNLLFAANKITSGNHDISNVVVRLLNQNAKTFAPFFGAPFMEKALEIMFFYTGKFFTVVPARFYIKEDLSQYVRN